MEDGRLFGLVEDWRGFLADGVDEIESRRLEKHLSSGRPCGSEEFVVGLEERTGRRLRALKRGWRKGRRRK